MSACTFLKRSARVSADRTARPWREEHWHSQWHPKEDRNDRTITDAAEAQRLHAELAKLTATLAELEEEWLELSSELESA